MKTALFLGAGASAFADQPTTKELLKRVQEQVGAQQEGAGHDYIMRVIKDGTYSDIEKLYDGIEQAIRTAENPNCGPIIAGIRDHDTALTHQEIIGELTALLSTIRNILLESFVIRSGHHGSIKQMYDKTRSAIEIKGSTELQVFTTNYDLVMEEYASKAGYEIVNGFKPYGYMRSIWDDAWDPHKERSMRLIKLHGSINWYSDADGNIVETGSVTRQEEDNDIMIEPTEGTKNYGRRPFPTLLQRFEESMKKVDMLLVIGFSYRDAEITEIIKRRLDEGMMLISVSPSASKDIVEICGAEPQTVDWNNFQFPVLDSKIALCDKKFEPNTIENVRSTLNAVYMYFLNIKARENRTVS